VFEKLSNQIDSTPDLLNFHTKHNLSWPFEEDSLLSSDGYFNNLTESQAIELSGILNDYLP